MPTPLSTRLGAPIAFVPASRLPEPELPAALDDGPVATPERKQPPAGLAFKPAGAAVDVDALLDRFEGPTSSARGPPRVRSSTAPSCSSTGSVRRAKSCPPG